jgi:sulfonate transport system substrate-binding protein
LVNLEPPAAQSAFQSGDIDAMALWNPQIALAVNEGARIIGEGRPPLDPNVFFFVASAEKLEDPTLRADLTDLVKRLGAAYQYGSDHPEAGIEALEQETGMDPKTAKETFEGGGNVVVRRISPQDIKNVQAIADDFYEVNEISGRVKITPLVDNLLPESYSGRLP